MGFYIGTPTTGGIKFAYGKRDTYMETGLRQLICKKGKKYMYIDVFADVEPDEVRVRYQVESELYHKEGCKHSMTKKYFHKLFSLEPTEFFKENDFEL